MNLVPQGRLNFRAVQISGLVDSVALTLLDELAPQPIKWKSGWRGRAAELETVIRSLGVRVVTEAKRRRASGAPDHHGISTQPFRAGLSLAGRPSGPKERLGSLLRFSHAEANQSLAIDGDRLSKAVIELIWTGLVELQTCPNWIFQLANLDST